ncbi:MAG: PilZ domain-containing protein [Planctomycetota bacterium]
MDDKIPQERRVTQRTDAGNLVVHTDVAESDLAHTLGLGVTIDMNEFGVKVQSTDPMPLGERFRFKLALKEEVVEATGQVVHVGRCLNGTFEMGIEFLEISAQGIEKIRAHLSEKPNLFGV